VKPAAYARLCGPCCAVMLLAMSSAPNIDMDFVKEGAKCSESLLRNYEADFEASFEFVHPDFLRSIDETEPQISRFEYHCVWEGSKFRIERITYDQHGKMAAEKWVVVNDERRMTHAPFREGVQRNRTPSGVIRADTSPNITELTPDTVMLHNVSGQPLSAILERGDGQLLGWQSVDGHDAIVLEVRNQWDVLVRLFLDPSRGFSVLRKEIYTAGGEDARLWLVVDNVSLEQVGDDLWFPVEWDQTLYEVNAAGELYKGQLTKVTVDKDSLRVNGVLQDGVFEIEYPNGTHVVDEIAGVSYIVGASAVPGDEALREFDELSQQEDAGRLQTAGASVGDTQARRGSLESLVGEVAGVAHVGRRGRAPTWLAIVGGIGLGVVAMVVIRMRRVARRPQR